VKWLLVIPHVVVLLFLWIAFVALTVVAAFSILFTRRYPRGIFEFNVGVMRWSWRVSFYSYSALATDRYPPFTLAECPDYPARLEVDYPEQLSRRLVLVKTIILALPHYIVIGMFTGGWGAQVWGPGLIGVLTIIAGVFLLIGRRYPQDIFDFVMGMNRWALRVAAYSALMCDAYPPFRLDPGSAEVAAPRQPTGPLPAVGEPHGFAL
jgi:hypothetical protein